MQKENPKIKLVLLSGLAGAGKTSATWAFEASGYYVVEDIPSKMVKDLFALFKAEPERFSRCALVLPLEDVGEAYRLAKKEESFEVTSIGLVCKRDVLLTRYKLTRHIHPYMIRGGYALEEALDIDWRLYESAEDVFDVKIDTSSLSESSLRQRIFSILKEGNKKMLAVSFTSFGYKFGVPLDADTIFDARVLANPYWVKGLSHLTGLDKEVIDFIEADSKTKPFMEATVSYLRSFLPLCEEDGRLYVYVGIGCSGGQHRSTYVASKLYEIFQHEYPCSLYHRELDKVAK